MTRAEVEAEYEVRDGIVRSPGKFEGEPAYAAALWPDADPTDEDGMFVVALDADDRAEWPELEGVDTLWFEESDSGFVFTHYEPPTVLLSEEGI